MNVSCAFSCAGGQTDVRGEMAQIVDHVVVFTQENHTTDNYFRAMRA